MLILERLAKVQWAALLTELVLIFVGITAALWFDNLKQGREMRALETSILRELETALTSDTADLNFNVRSTARAIQSIDTVLARLSSLAPYDSTMAGHFGRAVVPTNFIPNAAAYEYLKSQGLGTLSNDALRRQVTRYYEVQTQALTRIEELFVNRHWDDAVKPEMMQKFQYHFLFEPAVPHDYRALTQDRQYQTVLTTTRGILEWKDDLTAQTARRAQSLLEAISDELVGR